MGRSRHEDHLRKREDDHKKRKERSERSRSSSKDRKHRHHFDLKHKRSKNDKNDRRTSEMKVESRSELKPRQKDQDWMPSSSQGSGRAYRSRSDDYHRPKADEQTSVVADKQKPSFALSGKLTEDTNTFNGVVIKYNQPPEAKIPKRRWRLYPFKGDESLPFIPIHTQSAFLLGRDRKVADIPIDHPSCSSQHAVIQFRAVNFEREDGSKGKRTRPYVIDLESANGTFLNSKRIESRKYYEVFEKDVLKFGFSSRDYVVMHEDYSEKDEIT